MTLHIFLGYDSREPIVYHVASHSILTRASEPVAIHPIVQPALRAMGLYTRDRNAMESTEFAFSRFLVPYLMGYQGFALFADSDILCLTDIAELFREAERNPGKAVYVCQHSYIPAQAVKMDGQIQTVYPRKNWSSVILFDCAKCQMLTPTLVNSASGLILHRFQWLADEQIGALPLEWNVLVGEMSQTDHPPKILHYTNGSPCFRDYADGPYSREWYAEHRAMDAPPLVGQHNRAAWMADHARIA